MKLLNFLKRPFVGTQTTGNDAWLGYQGVGYAGIQGAGGQMVRRTLNATNPAMMIASQSFKINDPSVTGNNNGSLITMPLTANISDPRNI